MSLAVIDDFYNFDLLNDVEKKWYFEEAFLSSIFPSSKKDLQNIQHIFCLISNRILIADFENFTDY